MDDQDDRKERVPPPPPFPEEEKDIRVMEEEHDFVQKEAEEPDTETDIETDIETETETANEVNPYAHFDDTGENAARSADRLSEEDFLREPSVNYVRSTENIINIGDDIGLSNKDPMLKNLKIGVGWTSRSIEGDPLDIDLSCFLLDNKNMTRMDEDFVFYNHRESLEGEVRHLGDSRTGAGEGDDENIEIALQPLHFDVKKIDFTISIHDGEYREHRFSMLRNLYFRISNGDTEEELCILDMPPEFLDSVKGTAIMVGSLFRDGPKWRFHAVCEIIEEGGLATIARRHGLLVP